MKLPSPIFVPPTLYSTLKEHAHHTSTLPLHAAHPGAFPARLYQQPRPFPQAADLDHHTLIRYVADSADYSGGGFEERCCDLHRQPTFADFVSVGQLFEQRVIRAGPQEFILGQQSRLLAVGPSHFSSEKVGAIETEVHLLA